MKSEKPKTIPTICREWSTNLSEKERNKCDFCSVFPKCSTPWPAKIEWILSGPIRWDRASDEDFSSWACKQNNILRDVNRNRCVVETVTLPQVQRAETESDYDRRQQRRSLTHPHVESVGRNENKYVTRVVQEKNTMLLWILTFEFKQMFACSETKKKWPDNKISLRSDYSLPNTVNCPIALVWTVWDRMAKTSAKIT